MGFSKSSVSTCARYRATKSTSLAFGFDNVNNNKYWNFHPYPQRSDVAEVNVDL